MKKLRVRSSKQLDNFLKILAEESVKKSRNLLSEQPEDDAEEPDADAADEEEPEPEEEAEEEVEEEDEPEPEQEEGTVQVDFISFRDNIDSVRSGRSLKRSEVKQEVETFFNRLGSQDKRFFHDALQTLGKIMVGEVSGADAPLPSGPEGGEMGPAVDTASKDVEPETSQAPAKSDSGLEPPIRIGESQDKMLLRKKVRQLMGY